MKTLSQISKGLMIAILLYICTSLNGQVTFQNYKTLQKEATGKQMPDLVFEEVMNGMKGKTLTTKMTKGKVVILEFWTTWCAPCIKQFPKINKLAKDYEKEAIFVSITPETSDIVNRFLKRKSLETWIAMDTDKSVENYFGVIGYPTTIVIDKKGEVLEYLNPKQLSAEYLDGVISGIEKNEVVEESEKPQISTPKASAPTIGGAQLGGSGISQNKKKEKDSEPLYQVVIDEIPATGGQFVQWVRLQGILNAKGWSVRQALAFAHDLPEKAVFGPDSILDRQLEIRASMPSRNPELMQKVVFEGPEEKIQLYF